MRGFVQKCKSLKFGPKLPYLDVFRFLFFNFFNQHFSESSLSVFVQGAGRPDFGPHYTKYVELEFLKRLMVVRFITTMEKTY